MNNEPTKIKETIQEAKQALPRSRPTNLEEQTFRAWKNQIKAKWLEIAQKELALEGKSLEFDDHYKLYVKAVFATYFSDARECADCNAISRQLYNNKVHHLNLRPHKGLMVL